MSSEKHGEDFDVSTSSVVQLKDGKRIECGIDNFALRQVGYEIDHLQADCLANLI